MLPIALGALALFLYFASTAAADSKPRGVASPTQNFTVQLVKEIGGERFFDVFLQPGNTRVLRYAQRGSDKSTRREITHPPGTDGVVLANARRFSLGK